MADPEVKININAEYNGEAAKQALLDIENLPLEAQGLAEVFNQNFAAVEQMEEGLRRATEEMREHIASLDPASEGYAKAVAAAQSYITRQVTLAQQCEKVRGSIVEQAHVIEELASSLAHGRTSESAFADALEGISQEGIKAEQTIERLAAQLDALNARKAATDLSGVKPPPTPEIKPPKVPTVPAEAMKSWSGFFNYVKQGVATSSTSLTGLMNAAGGLARIGAWGTVAKVAFDGLGKSFRVFSDQIGMGIEESTTLSGVFDGFLETASEGVASIVGGITGYLTGADEAKASTDSWAGSIGEVINNLARVVNYKEELAAIAKQEAAYNTKLAADQKTARQDILDAAQVGFDKDLDAKIAAAKAAAAELKESAQSEYETATRQLEARKDAANREFEIDKQRIELEKERGDISKSAAANRTAALEEEHAKELAAIDQEAAELKEKYAAALADAAEKFKGELGKVLTEGDLAKWAPVLEVQLPDMDRLRVLTDQLELTKKKLGEGLTQAEMDKQDELIAERVEILNQVRALAKTINSIDSSLGVTEDNAGAFAQGLQESAAKLQEIKETATQESEQRQAALEAAEEGVESAKEDAEATKERAALNRQITKQQQRNAKEKEASARAEKRAEDSVKTLSKERENELKNITEKYKTSGRYAEQDNRSEAQKLAADKKILQERLKELTALKQRSGGADADTQQRINEALRQTQSEIRGYNQAIAAGRAAASQTLQQWKTSGPGPTNNTYKGNMKRMQRAMDNLARQYERAAAKGDTKAMENINRRGNACAQSLERLSGYTGKYADQWNQIQSEGAKLQQAFRGLTVKEEKELSTLQKNEQHTARRQQLEAKINRWKEQHASAEQRAARAAERAARETERNASRGRAQTASSQRGNQGQQQGQRILQENQRTAQEIAQQTALITQAAQQSQATLQAAAASVTQIAAAITALNSTIMEFQTALANLAAEIANVSATSQAGIAANRESITANTNAIGALQGQIASLQGAVSRLASQI